MLLTYLVIILINVLIIGVGVKLGCLIIREEMPWMNALLIAGITTGVSIIPVVGMFAGVLTLLVCLVTLGEMDFWPEGVVVTIVVKALSIAATLTLMVMLR